MPKSFIFLLNPLVKVIPIKSLILFQIVSWMLASSKIRKVALLVKHL